MTKPVEFYSLQSTAFTSELRELRIKSNIISFLRLAIFIGLLITVYFLIRQPAGGLYITAIALSIAFVWMVRLSVTLSFSKRLAQKILAINDNETMVLDGKANMFPDGENVHNRSMHANDLDVFGEGSLFHLLNRTTTAHGNASLASLLNKPQTNVQKIRYQQRAVKVMAAQAAQRQIITAHGLLRDESEGNIEDVASWLGHKNRITGKIWLRWVRFILPVVSVGGLIYYLDTNNPIPVAIGVILSWIVIGSHSKYIHVQHELTAKKQAILDQYAFILKHFYQLQPEDSALLKELQGTAREAHHEIFRLSRLSALLDQRLNLLVNFFLNGFLMYDIHCMIALEKWKEKNRSHFNKWIQAVGEIESLNSLATFAFNNPSYSYPDITEGQLYVNAVQLSHPLIPQHEQVANDIVAGKNVKLLLVTGSNMSGKSTFLRTLGVNVLLAQCGAPVCAEHFECTPMKILSSIRINDSLHENTSYFMAELKRLKRVITELETGAPALVLIDEVLRGTNSDDKTHGSEALIIRLLKYNCLALFATHDLSLSALEERYEGVSNYCFESTITDGELSFDYKLRRGIATNKNASFLMQKMGII
jgi:DNA mismatch repair ATPase MutS